MIGIPQIIERAKQALARAGLPWDVLSRSAEEIVLFGSRAAGVDSVNSDWDFLCIGDGSRQKDETVDIVWLKPERKNQREWLGSELAVHIAGYGIWMLGSPSWVGRVFVSAEAIAHKERKICARVKGMMRIWGSLLPIYRVEKALQIRRELLRLHFLIRGEAVPPTPSLDGMLSESCNSENLIKSVAEELFCSQQAVDFLADQASS